MYYKGHSVKLAVAKYEDSNFCEVLMVNHNLDVIEVLSINPKETISDYKSKDVEKGPNQAIIKKEFLNFFVLNSFYSSGNKININNVEHEIYIYS